jgi:hypothetical protein
VNTARRWLIIGALLVMMLVGCMYVLIFMAAGRLSTPVATSLVDLNPATIAEADLLVIRRPDGGADVTAGKTEAVRIIGTDAAALVEALKVGKAVETARGVWMGKLVLHLADGRKLETLLYSVGDVPGGPMRFKIEQFQYELESSTPFLKCVDEIDAKRRGR